MTYQFKIQIKNITNPPVWRRITVPSHFTFLEFHYAIQVAFNWGNAHLFQFSPQGYASYPQIKQIFGDEWVHTITLEKILTEKTMYPSCIAGKGMCPPEDCGGPCFYNDELKHILADKKHPQHKEYKEWYFFEGQKKWDPEEFDLNNTKEYMTEFFTKNLN